MNLVAKYCISYFINIPFDRPFNNVRLYNTLYCTHVYDNSFCTHRRTMSFLGNCIRSWRRQLFLPPHWSVSHHLLIMHHHMSNSLFSNVVEQIHERAPVFNAIKGLHLRRSSRHWQLTCFWGSSLSQPLLLSCSALSFRLSPMCVYLRTPLNPSKFAVPMPDLPVWWSLGTLSPSYLLHPRSNSVSDPMFSHLLLHQKMARAWLTLRLSPSTITFVSQTCSQTPSIFGDQHFRITPASSLSPPQERRVITLHLSLLSPWIWVWLDRTVWAPPLVWELRILSYQERLTLSNLCSSTMTSISCGTVSFASLLVESPLLTDTC